MAPIKGFNLVRTAKDLIATIPTCYVIGTVYFGAVPFVPNNTQTGIDKVRSFSPSALVIDAKTDLEKGINALIQFNIKKAQETNTGRSILWLAGFGASLQATRLTKFWEPRSNSHQNKKTKR